MSAPDGGTSGAPTPAASLADVSADVDASTARPALPPPASRTGAEPPDPADPPEPADPVDPPEPAGDEPPVVPVLVAAAAVVPVVAIELPCPPVPPRCGAFG